jgi:hypothetical protein
VAAMPDSTPNRAFVRVVTTTPIRIPPTTATARRPCAESGRRRVTPEP